MSQAYVPILTLSFKVSIVIQCANVNVKENFATC